MSLIDENPYSYSAATIDGPYRYRLIRHWVPLEWPRTLTVVMLNPSTADASDDDPTIRRCIGYAKREGCTAIQVVNLYAWRATDPAELKASADPVGPRNDTFLERAFTSARLFATPVLVAWGAHAPAERVRQVAKLARDTPLLCLGTNKGGSPKHPLYLAADAPLVPWR